MDRDRIVVGEGDAAPIRPEGDPSLGDEPLRVDRRVDELRPPVEPLEVAQDPEPAPDLQDGAKVSVK